MTLMEMMLALGIFSFVALSSFSFMFPYFFMSTRMRGNISDLVDNGIAIRMMTKEFEGSYIMRAGNISCDDAGLFTTDKAFTAGPEFEFEDGKMLTFATSIHSSIGARDLSRVRSLHVSNPNMYPKGSLVLLMDVKNSSNASYNIVDAVDMENNRVTLSSVDLGSSPTRCNPAGAYVPLETLFELTNVVAVHRVRILTYERRGSEIFRSAWPDEGDAAETPKQLAFSGVRAIHLKSGWQSYLVDAPVGEVQRSGRWTAEVKYTLFTKSMTSEDRVNEAETISRMSYDLSGTKRINTAVSTTATTVDVSFPTCGVFASPALDSLQPGEGEEDAFANAKLFRVGGMVSEDVVASITVTFIASPEGQTLCYNEDDIVGGRAVSGAHGHTGAVTLNRTGTGYSNYICAVKGAMQLSAAMKFVDVRLGRTIGVTCSGTDVAAPASYRFKGAAPTCFRSGEIDFGSPLIEEGGDGTTPGPSLYLSSESCYWRVVDEAPQGGPGSVREVWRACDWTDNDAYEQELLRVQFEPQGFVISNGGLRVNCTE